MDAEIGAKPRLALGGKQLTIDRWIEYPPCMAGGL